MELRLVPAARAENVGVHAGGERTNEGTPVYIAEIDTLLATMNDCLDGPIGRHVSVLAE